MKKISERQKGYEDCRKDMIEDLKSVVNMLEGVTDRNKVVNYIKEYLLKV